MMQRKYRFLIAMTVAATACLGIVRHAHSADKPETTNVGSQPTVSQMLVIDLAKGVVNSSTNNSEVTVIHLGQPGTDHQNEPASARVSPAFTVRVIYLNTPGKAEAQTADKNGPGGDQVSQALIQSLAGQGKFTVIRNPELAAGLLQALGSMHAAGTQEASKSGQVEVVNVPAGGDDKQAALKAAQSILQSISGSNETINLSNLNGKLNESAGNVNIKVIRLDAQPPATPVPNDPKTGACPAADCDPSVANSIQVIVIRLGKDAGQTQVVITPAVGGKSDAAKDVPKN